MYSYVLSVVFSVCIPNFGNGDIYDAATMVTKWEAYLKSIRETSFKCTAALEVNGKPTMNYETVIQHGSNGKMLLKKTEKNMKNGKTDISIYCISDKYIFNLTMSKKEWLVDAVCKKDDVGGKYIYNNIVDELGLLKRPTYIYQKGNLLESLKEGSLIFKIDASNSSIEISNPKCNPVNGDYMRKAKLTLNDHSGTINECEIDRKYIDGDGIVKAKYSYNLLNGIRYISEYQYGVSDKTTKYGIVTINYKAYYDSHRNELFEDSVFALSSYVGYEPQLGAKRQHVDVPYHVFISVAGAVILLFAIIITRFRARRTNHE